jgi:hypothetical protein
MKGSLFLHLNVTVSILYVQISCIVLGEKYLKEILCLIFVSCFLAPRPAVHEPSLVTYITCSCGVCPADNE